MNPDDLEGQIAGLAALDEPTRRALYFYIVDRRRDVSRDEAAQAVGISHHLAGFHLDRLVAAGLLEASFRRLSGRAGPGAGRPAKVYRRSGRQLEISLPQRNYELAARLLAAAIDSSQAPRTGQALRTAARELGERIGAEARAQAGARPGGKRLLAASLAALAAHGYEPEKEAGALRLRNCPFHALADEHRDLVCGMNLALIEGLVDGLALPGAKAMLTPAPGRCCVSLELETK